uniref:Uncharacterized protein n=1 Tax=Knipowitschia caucasica TaxID=637954 RepID=A0AAV2LIB4_KNICA
MYVLTYKLPSPLTALCALKYANSCPVSLSPSYTLILYLCPNALPRVPDLLIEYIITSHLSHAINLVSRSPLIPRRFSLSSVLALSPIQTANLPPSSAHNSHLKI